jgi:dimethylamine monooxygenase subunit A
MNPMLDREPEAYFPFENGRYEVRAGLFRLGAQPVHGRVESHLFSFDRTYPAFIAAKVGARTRGLHQSYLQAALSPQLREAAVQVALEQIESDSGGAITWDGRRLSNVWLGWSAALDLTTGAVGEMQRRPVPLAHLIAETQPIDALDFLAMNVQEDVSILARDPDTGAAWLAALHVLLPERWDPRDKIGRDFVAVHAPVAGSGPMNASAPKLVEAVVTRGPFLRFVWGVTDSDQLDHHPAAPRHQPRPFDPAHALVRVERQTLSGCPDAQGALFTIRPYLYPLAQIAAEPERAGQLVRALEGMTPDQLAYKSMADLAPPLLAWLRRG